MAIYYEEFVSNNLQTWRVECFCHFEVENHKYQ